MRRTRGVVLFSLLWVACASTPRREIAAAGESFELVSPNRKISVQFALARKGQAVYGVTLGKQTVVRTSPLGLEFEGQSQLQNLFLKNKSHRSVDENYRVPVGKARSIRNRFEEFGFTLAEREPPSREVNIVFRVFDDGVGFRYEIPDQPGFKDFAISRELTGFRLERDPELYALELPFTSTFEGYYRKGHFGEFSPEKTMNLPLLAIDDGHYAVAITEAALIDFPGLYLSPAETEMLSARLAPVKDTTVIRAVGHTPFVTPWRAILVAGTPGPLLESNLVNNLNEKSAIKDTTWIRPGKIIFPWWSGYEIPLDRDPSHRPGLNTWALKQYVDFCAKNKIEFFSFDGFDQAWYGGDIGNPPAGVDVTRAIPQIDMPEVLRYAKSKGVRARLWMHKDALLQAGDLDAVFAVYERWGIEGVMIDFMNRDDQETVRLEQRMIELAAKHRLTINFHGSWKPTGVTRTYPNLLSHEAVMSSEYNRFVNTRDNGGIVNNGQDSYGATPEHEMMYAWIRQIAGPTDVHPGSFNPVLPQNFDPEKDALRGMGTLARQLALYVVVESGLPMVADSPIEYSKRPAAFDFIKRVPAAWDEIRVVGGRVGESIAIARRRGEDWFLGAMTDRSPKEMKIPLNFLGDGSYTAEIFADGPAAGNRADDVVISRRSFGARDELKLALAGSGGAAVHFRKIRRR